MRPNYKKYINNVKDHPEEGILFRDIQPLLANQVVFDSAITSMRCLTSVPDYWVAIEARGFIFATALSIRFGGGIKLIRKWGKLPQVDLVTASYKLEYGVDMMQIQKGTGSVVIVDDVYASGGTMSAAEEIVSKAGYTHLDSICFIDIGIKESNVKSVVHYG